MALTDTNALTSTAAVEVVTGSGAFSTARIEQIILAVSDEAETFCGRAFRKTQITTTSPESHQGNGLNLMALDRYPITAVERVRIDGVAVTNYERDGKRDAQGLLYRLSGWPLSCPTHGDITDDPDVNRRAYNVDVAYTAGYVLPNDSAGTRDLPRNLEQAVIDEVVRRLNQPVRGIKSERTPGGYSYDLDGNAGGNAFYEALVSWRRQL